MKYINPIIKGFNPDPSICRVGNDYYLTTSSFEYFPGIPIYHSVDLVNWELIGNAISRCNQLPMDLANSSGGIWAPTIRYNNGVFYITATFSEKGNFIISADNPYGEWSEIVWVEMDGIDPSMYFEGSDMYYCANDCGIRSKFHKGEGISLAKVDVNTGKVIGEMKRIWTGTRGGFLEAPHIYRIGEWYYLIAAEGGTRFNHMVTIARSKNLWGEYESYAYNPILTNRNDTSKQAMCCGHADFVDDVNGNWWAVHLGTRPAVADLSNLGRETFLIPVTWEDEWPKLLNGKSALSVDAPVKTEQHIINEVSVDFSGDYFDKKLIFIKSPDFRNYEQADNSLTLYLSTVKITDQSLSPTFAAVRQMDFECVIQSEFEFDTKENGDEAGVAIYLTPKFMYRIFKVRENGKNYIVVKKIADDFIQIAYKKEIIDGMVLIKIKADKEKYEFYYAVGDEDMEYACSASTRFVSCELAGKCFTGTVIGMYAQAECNTDARAKFNYFKQSK